MEPGVGDCVVWWDAWAVAVAVLGIYVATVGAFIAGASAIAVYWLGMQANLVAKVGLNNGIAERQRLNDEADTQRDREEKVLLCFLAAELDAAHVKMNALHQLLQSDGCTIETFVENVLVRRALAKKAAQVRLGRLHSVVGRLHAIQASTGMRLGRLAGDVSVLQRHLGDLANVSDVEVDQASGKAEQTRELLRFGYSAVKGIAARAASDSSFLGKLTNTTAAGLKL
jgi:hypothetical protein